MNQHSRRFRDHEQVSISFIASAIESMQTDAGLIEEPASAAFGHALAADEICPDDHQAGACHQIESSQSLNLNCTREKKNVYEQHSKVTAPQSERQRS
jgi:hypothetical protein